MNALERQARAAVDLGLLTRVLCHELNNLIANQRGYARLLSQHPAGANAGRWAGELSTAAEDLHGLVGAVQQWTRHSADASADGATAALLWPPPAEVATLAAQLAALGCGLPGLALCRVLCIVADEAAAPVQGWSVPRRGSPPPHGALLGVADSAATMLAVEIADLNQGAGNARWAESASHILPPAGSSDAAWRRALVLGLLRQSGADIYVLPDQPARVSLWLPIGGAALESWQFGA